MVVIYFNFYKIARIDRMSGRVCKHFANRQLVQNIFFSLLASKIQILLLTQFLAHRRFYVYLYLYTHIHI